MFLFFFSNKCECKRLGTGYESYETQTALTGYLLKYNVQFFVNRNNQSANYTVVDQCI